MIEGIGFFHFGTNHGQPFVELRKALSGNHDCRNSLVVLPEAFNLGRSYNDYEDRREPLFPAAEALDCLLALAGEFHATFVAGLIGNRRSSAYWIEPGDDPEERIILVSEKATCDGSPHYDPCDPRTAIRRLIGRGPFCIGTLICNDALDPPEEFIRNLAGTNALHKILCIPACMGSQSFSKPLGNNNKFKNKRVVMANSNPEGCGSFITGETGAFVKEKPSGDCENEILVQRLVDRAEIESETSSPI